MKELMGYINTVGFPIVVALYSLIRLEKAMNANTQVLTMLAEKIGGIDNVK